MRRLNDGLRSSPGNSDAFQTYPPYESQPGVVGSVCQSMSSTATFSGSPSSE